MTEDEIKKLNKFFRTFDRFRKTREYWDALIEGIDEIALGDLYHDIGLRYHSTRPKHERDQNTAVLDTASMTYAIKARTEEEDDKQNAQKWEHWLNAAVPMMNIGTVPLRLSRSSRAGFGVGVWKFDLNEAWFPKKGDDSKTKEEKQHLGLPFVWTSVPYETCAWFDDETGVQFMMEQSLRPINPIVKAFRLKYEDGVFTRLGEGVDVDTSPAYFTETVKFTQISTPETISYWVESKRANGRGKEAKFLTSIPNPWKRVPYVVVPAILISSTDPDKRYQPLIQNTLTIAIYENYMYSLVFLAARLTAAPIYDLVSIKTAEPIFDEETKKPIIIEVDPNKPVRYPLPKGTELKQRTIQMGADIEKVIDKLRIEADRVGFPSALLGEAPQPRTPAYALAEARGAASIFIDPATRAEERALGQVERLLASCIKNYIGDTEIPVLSGVEDEKGKINTLTIKGEEIGEFDVTVGVSVQLTSLEMAQKEMLRKDVAEGFLSPETYMEESGVKDVERELRLINEGMMRQDIMPSIRHAAIQMAVAKSQRKVGVRIELPEGGAPPRGGPAGRTRPAQQVRPTGTEPSPIEQGLA